MSTIDNDAQSTLQGLLNNNDLSQSQASELLTLLTNEDLDKNLAGDILKAMVAKGETAEEILGFSFRMRELARKPRINTKDTMLDVVGTGGDSSGSFNLSTGAALLLAACGRTVVKHGNRSVTSRSGSADVLESLGLPLPLDEKQSGQCLDATGFTFLFAPYYHPAMKALAEVRRAIGIRTVFNLLGPLTNPAQPGHLLLGAYSPGAARIMAETLAGAGVQKAYVVHGEPGWDEATPVGPFLTFIVNPGNVRCETRDPANYGLKRCSPESLSGGDADSNAKALQSVFCGEDRGPHRDALLLAAGLGLELTDKVPDIRQGIEKA
ncbi:MAG: anthranilate phosphoribosyltransferase, partial [Pseudomonadota bacterium]